MTEALAESSDADLSPSERHLLERLRTIRRGERETKAARTMPRNNPYNSVSVFGARASKAKD